MTYEQAAEEQNRLQYHFDTVNKGMYFVRIMPKTFNNYINFIKNIKDSTATYSDVKNYCSDNDYQVISFPRDSTDYL